MGVLADWQIERDIKIEPLVKEQVAKGVISYGLSSYGVDARIGYKFKIATNTFSAVVDPKALNPRSFVDVDVTPKCHVVEAYGSGPSYRCKNCGRGLEYNRDLTDTTCPEDQPDHILIPPNSFALGETVETFTVPRDCLAVCLGKSTYARVGIIINVTPLEPEWAGKVTVEISNTWPLPAKIYAGEGIMQVIFLRTDGHNEAVFNTVRRLCGDGMQIASSNEARKTLALIEELLHREMPRGTCRTSYADRKGRYQDQTGLTLPFVEEKT